MTARELLDRIGAHEGFLKSTEWITEQDSLVFHLASRVERVLALHSRSAGEDVYCQGCVDQFWPCPTVRILNGEEVPSAAPE